MIRCREQGDPGDWAEGERQDVREELLKFHSKHYSANILSLALLGKDMYNIMGLAVLGNGLYIIMNFVLG